MRPVVEMRPDLPVVDALRRFRSGRKHLAIVREQGGPMLGVCTLEDVLEEIVGEIEDEFDTDATEIIERPDGALLCRGIAEIADVFRKLSIEGVQTERKTLSGFLSEHLGSVPAAGAHVDVGGFRFEVLKANNRRAERVRVERLPNADSDAS